MCCGFAGGRGGRRGSVQNGADNARAQTKDLLLLRRESLLRLTHLGAVGRREGGEATGPSERRGASDTSTFGRGAFHVQLEGQVRAGRKEERQREVSAVERKLRSAKVAVPQRRCVFHVACGRPPPFDLLCRCSPNVQGTHNGCGLQSKRVATRTQTKAGQGRSLRLSLCASD